MQDLMWGNCENFGGLSFQRAGGSVTKNLCHFENKDQ